jgi:hypothetical protein
VSILQPSSGKSNYFIDSEMLDTVSLHQMYLGNKIYQQLSNNGLIDACTMLNTEGRQDIMLKMDKSLVPREWGEHRRDCKHRTNVHEERWCPLIFWPARDQHTTKELTSLPLLKLLHLIGVLNCAYHSVMDILADLAIATVITVGSTFIQSEEPQ